LSLSTKVANGLNANDLTDNDKTLLLNWIKSVCIGRYADKNIMFALCDLIGGAVES